MAIRFYAWSDKHKRKKRSTQPHGHGTIFYNAPKDFSHLFTRKDRAKESLLMRSFRDGNIDNDSLNNRLPRRHKNGATWLWW